MIRESTVGFGETGSLVGVLAEPAAGFQVAQRPSVVLLNPGLLHRVGASRLYVQLARRLAERGHRVLRFDFSGVGDSAPRRDGLPFEQSAVREARAAMDHLAATRGARTFAIGGLCSGADVAFEVGRVDERVRGLLLLDPQAYRTPRYYLERYGRRLLHPGAWLNSIRVRLPRRGPEPAVASGDLLQAPLEMGAAPPRERIAGALRSLAGRGGRVLLVFSGDQSELYNHRGQFGACFRRSLAGAQVCEEYLPSANHIFSHLGHQRQLAEIVCRWAGSGPGEEVGTP